MDLFSSNHFLRRSSPLRLGHVLITGSSRGIGEALAHQLAQSADRITICARNEPDLERVKGDLRITGTKVESLLADLSSFESGHLFGKRVLSEIGAVDTLVLNAGVSYNREFKLAAPADIFHEFGVNYLAPIGLTQSLLPSLGESKSPRIVVISSLTAVVPFPSNANYAASKSSLCAWARSLALEEKKLKLLIVLPGLTSTRLAAGKKTILPAMTAHSVAKEVHDAIKSGQTILVPGKLNRVARRLSQYAPDHMDSLVSIFGKWIIPGWKENHAE